MNRLLERFINLIGDHKDKAKHADEVMDVLQKSYAKIGGIHGSGFTSKEDMIRNIPFWKIKKHDNKIVSVAMYKDKSGRKGVAYGTDGSEHGKVGLGDIMKNDMKQKRSYSELSGAALSFLKRNLGHDKLRDFLIHPDNVHHHLDHDDVIRKAPHDDPEVQKHLELKDHFYQRKIGDDWHTKIMLGNPNQKIKT